MSDEETDKVLLFQARRLNGDLLYEYRQNLRDIYWGDPPVRVNSDGVIYMRGLDTGVLLPIQVTLTVLGGEVEQVSPMQENFPIVNDPSAAWREDGSLEGLSGPEAMQRALCIDFDGVLHAFRTGWQGHDVVADGPVPGAVRACWKLHEAGWKLYVLSSRMHLEPVQEWLDRHDFPPMTLTRVKPIAMAYIDDRGVRFDGDWESVRKLFC